VPPSVPLPIAFVMPRFEPGGTERQMIELVRRLDPSRWQVHIACFEKRGAWFDRAANAAASVTEFPVTSFRTPAVLGHLRAFGRWCRANQISVVHTTDLYANIFGLPGAALARVPVRIANRREINPDKTAAQIAAQRAAYGCAHKIVANSQTAARRLLSERVPPGKVMVVPNGVAVEPCPSRTPRGPLRRAVTVANLRREKGHDVLLDAAALVIRSFPDARFEIVGGGPARDALVARAEALGVSHAVSFLGHRDDVPARLADADLFVLPSRSEACPNAVLEAMAAALPIVASRVGGIPELVVDNRSGLLVDPDNPRALADGICRLMSEPSLGARIGQAGHAVARSRYSFERMVAAFETIYITELARRGALGAGQLELAAS
jgi:glycosyltransferase involved in cell wall biosynthesis